MEAQKGYIKDDDGNIISPITSALTVLLSDSTNVEQNILRLNKQLGSVTSVAGKTGAVVLAPSDVGLSNVNNTSDIDKPISLVVQSALNGLDGRINDIDNIMGALDDLLQAINEGGAL